MSADKANYVTLPANEALYKANLEAFGKDMGAILEEHPDTPIAIDPDIKVSGIKNPLCLVVVGFSTRKIVDTVLKSKKKIEKLVVIEPSLSVFKATLKREFVADLAMAPDTDFLIGIHPDQLFNHLFHCFTSTDPKKGSSASLCGNPEVICDPFVYPSKDGAQHEVVQHAVKTVMEASRQVFISMGCASDSFNRFEQLIRNEKTMVDAWNISKLYGKFEDQTAVVVGGGPSVQDFIEAYHKHDLAERTLVIACDASLKKLLDNGIRPHIVTRCERKLTTVFHGITRELTKGIYFAGYPWVSPAYFDLFDDKFMLMRTNGVCMFAGYPHGAVNGGVSAANCAMELGFLLGCKNIVLTGVDLCFIDGKSHVEGTQVEFDPEKSREKWKQVPGNSGEQVTTIPVWQRCLNEYEMALFKHQEKPTVVWNTSVKGARITGTKVLGWEGLYNEGVFVKRGQRPDATIQENLSKVDAVHEQEYAERKKITIAVLEELDVELEKLFKINRDTLVNCGREEEKAVMMLGNLINPDVFFREAAKHDKTLSETYKEPIRQIDALRLKYFTNPHLQRTLLEIGQLDYYQTANRCGALPNVLDSERDRHKEYITQQMMLLRHMHFYTKKLANLFKNGFDGSVQKIFEKPFPSDGTEQ